MFTRNTFNIRTAEQYPPFAFVLQSWYSPLINSKPQEDAGLSACVTLGIARKDWVHPVTKTRHANQVIVASALNDYIANSEHLKKNVLALREDYLNKTTKKIGSPRSADAIIIEAERGKYNHVVSGWGADNLQRFYPERSGDTLEKRIAIAYPFCRQISFTNLPNEQNLRPDDAHLLGMLLAYPCSEAYALTSAFVQAVLWLHSRGHLDDESRKPLRSSKPREPFYTSDD